MNIQTSPRFKFLWLIAPIMVGVVFFMLMKGTKQPPDRATTDEIPRLVRIQTIQTVDFVPKATGYGEVQPAQVWKAIAQVSGRITAIHPRLNNGEIIQQGESLLQIDPIDYELNLAQAETELDKLDVEKTNAAASLKIEERNLALARKEYQRLQKLVKKGSVSQSDADNAERTMLSTSTLVQNLKNTLALLPANIKLQQAKVLQAQRDLANTNILAPFNMRVSALSIEADQFVASGTHMFSGDSVDRVEITAQVAMSSLKNLFTHKNHIPTDITLLSNNMDTLTGFKPTVRLDMGNDQYAQWEADFVRFSDTVDLETRTMGVVVAVDHPLKKIIPGVRPPLSKGMFVEVNIDGITQVNSIVIPRSALRNGSVYVMNENNRLEIRSPQKRYDQDQSSIIESGLKPGEQLVLTDLIPAIEGMLLKASIDQSGE